MCTLYYQINKDFNENNYNDYNLNIVPKKRLRDTVNNIYIETLNNNLYKKKEKSKIEKKKKYK